MVQSEEWSSAGLWAALRERKLPCAVACSRQRVAGPGDWAGELAAKAGAPDLGPGGLQGLSSIPIPTMNGEHIPPHPPRSLKYPWVKCSYWHFFSEAKQKLIMKEREAIGE